MSGWPPPSARPTSGSARSRARELASRALAASRAGGWPLTVGYAECVAGRIALASGSLDDAEAAVRQALRTFVSIDARCQVARSHLVLADVLAARGDREAAQAALATAHELFRRMSAPRLAERTERVAEALGLPCA